MILFKYGLVALSLIAWFACSSSVDLYVEEMHGDREKRTLILGVLFKKLLLQQALARNNMRTNSTTMMSPPQAMMSPPEAMMSPPQAMMSPPAMMTDPGNDMSGPQPPEQSAPPPQSPPQSPPPQPAQSSPPPLAQEPPPQLSMPQGLRNPPAVPQGPPASQNFPQQQQSAASQGFPSLNAFNPSQQTLLFPPNYPFGLQRFRQLPFGPAPPLGAHAGPQTGTRLPNYFPFNFQNGYFQNIPQQPSFLPPPGLPSQSTSQVGSQNPQLASPQQTPSDSGPSQGQIPPSGGGTPEEAPPSDQGPPGPGEPSQAPQPSPSSQESAPEPSGATPPAIQNPPAAEGESAQELPPNSTFGPAGLPSTPNSPEPAPQPGQLPTERDGAQPNFSFGPGPLGLQQLQVAGGDFSFDPQQSPRPSNGQETPPEQQGPPPNFPTQQLDPNLQQQFETQLQQQLSSNGLSTDPTSIPQNFASPNESPQPQPGQPDNRFFDLRQFAGADNSVFDFPQEGGPPSNGNSEQQQQPQPESFQNGLFAPSGSGQEQFSSQSVADPRSNFAFRGGQQFDFSSPFQDSGNFQRNFFQQNVF